ncbi:CRISPR-associated protein Cas6 [Thermosulfidibacter takaii ABI70S6]|uniref:CRISPR-associated endoribonuclease n=1 Tax=Thermosulfidibacter takaii (strain DSM 17441 / JCM 13301 / NBRC 103674 / ABI70S6) TaxID=1298851 RepID=A0A0S3QU37_THET7|nr:CRISPR-associated endoribonuclease Cas6 [Thermosulfidibacter takaii]BAT71830.1 CRISPR-associated protein Cas6 [Thermosulfidibacter takaii ABI70S6]
MRVVIKFEALNSHFTLPVNYNHIIQGFIYNNIQSTLAAKYHNVGYRYNKRVYKMFVFSRLFSKEKMVKNGTITFKSPVYFKLGAMDSELLESLAVNLLRKEIVELGGNKCRFLSIEVETPVKVEEKVLVKAISPISVHRVLYDATGKRKTYYYSPWERDFSQLILDNLKRKAKALYGEKMELPEVKNPVIVPVKVSSGNQKVVIYKRNPQDRGYVIKGWLGLYELRLPQFYFDIAYSAGFGSRNSLGFGMVDVVISFKCCKNA